MAAEWLANKLTRIGIDSVQIIPTEPTRSFMAIGCMLVPRNPPCLFYGHYDVIPPEPLGRMAIRSI